jgi:hypothetical protein
LPPPSSWVELVPKQWHEDSLPPSFVSCKYGIHSISFTHLHHAKHI